MPMLRDVCSGTDRLSRHLGDLPGYLIKENAPGSGFVIWDPHRALPAGYFTNKQDTLDFGYSMRQIDTANLTGNSVRSGGRAVGGRWKQPYLQVADLGRLPRRDLVPFTKLLIERNFDAANKLLLPSIPTRKDAARG
ncbi:hypothetical protein ACFZAM_32045 [Streptomyces sp. NPDC008079]|uniref:hypothetical protein n=1 Tax=Streptomyces sp. NPDC008079 TaxID=3364806 RepID=UPI0036E7A958